MWSNRKAREPFFLVNNIYFNDKKENWVDICYSSNWILSKLTLMVKNEAGEFYDLNLTICLLTSDKHSFGVHTDKSPKICTHVEQIFLYKAGLLLNIDVTVPFLKRKNIAKNCVFIQCTPHCQGVSVSPTNQMPAFILIDSPQYPTWATRRQWIANFPHKCTLVRFFCKVNNFELMNNFSHRCTASNLQVSNAFLNIFQFF